MGKFFTIISVFVCCLLLNGAELVKNNKATACIIIDKNAPAPIRFAAKEISVYAEKITGTALPMKEKTAAGCYQIRLAVCNDDSLGDEGYKINGNKNHLLISGNTPRAVLYGAYAFIEKFFGVRWFAPGELYEHCPENSVLEISDDINISAKPQFSVRQIGFVGSTWNSTLHESHSFLVRSRWQVRGKPNHKKLLKEYDKYGAIFSGGGHVLSKLVPDSLFETHPEYFALVKGRRIRQISEDGKAQSQPCTSNPEVIERAIKGIIDFFDKSPSESCFLIGNNDVQVWCECDSCIALDSAKEREKGFVATRFFKFINEVVKGVRKKHPDAKIYAWGYQNYRFAPDGVKPDPSLRINLCDHQRCYRHSMGNMTCKQNDLFRDMFKSWRNYGLPVTERGYQEVLLRSGYFYLPIEKIIAEDLIYFRKIGVDGYAYIIHPPDGIYGKHQSAENIEYRKNNMYCLWQSIYVCGKMMWDTQLDPDSIMEDAGKHFYGRAWSVMKKYRKLLTEAYVETAGHIVYANPAVDIGKCLQKPGVKQQLISLLQEAEKLAASDPDKKVAQRIALEKKYFQKTWLANAAEFEKTLSRTSSALQTSEKIIIDGSTDEKIWTKAQYIAGFPKNAEPPAYPADIFAKILYDKNFIYLAIEGSNPVDGEKWLLVLPDHQNLSKPFKTFELNKNIPFEKKSRKYDNKICYELKIPRKSINLAENASALLLNIYRIQFSSVCSELFKEHAGFATLGTGAVINGNFNTVKKTSARQQKISTESFPAKWGFSGRNAAFKNGKIDFSGVIYQYMSVNGGKNGGILRLDIAADTTGAGKAFLKPYLSLQKSPAKGKFRHELKKEANQLSVSGRKIYSFTFELVPAEKGYLYIQGRNASIENISCSFTPNK